MKKLNLKPIKVQSFVTSLNNGEKKRLKGGTDPLHCWTPVTCDSCNTCETCSCEPCGTTGTGTGTGTGSESCDPCTESECSLCPFCG